MTWYVTHTVNSEITEGQRMQYLSSLVTPLICLQSTWMKNKRLLEKKQTGHNSALFAIHILSLTSPQVLLVWLPYILFMNPWVSLVKRNLKKVCTLLGGIPRKLVTHSNSLISQCSLRWFMPETRKISKKKRQKPNLYVTELEKKEQKSKLVKRNKT